ncbi:OsmC family protein [Ancylobacter terrae]|uniref:OsmC family protein n=1 Tax=Ancylobacter sp. sgz301288 TaxID=3342077 RepID=UPI003859A427
MTRVSVSFRGVPDSGAALGRAGMHSVVVDRPEGRAGGTGLGFNGGQLLALAIGGCLCNDLHYVAHAMGITLTSLAVEVSVEFDGEPLLARGAEAAIAVTSADPADDLDDLVARVRADSTVANSLARGVPVTVARPAG